MLRPIRGCEADAVRRLAGAVSAHGECEDEGMVQHRRARETRMSAGPVASLAAGAPARARLRNDEVFDGEVWPCRSD